MNNSEFNCFDFMKNRRKSIPPTEEELHSFNVFMCELVLSMDVHTQIIDVLNNINTESFYALPKELQCKAFTTFDGSVLDGSWKISKKTIKNEKSDLVEKIMKVYNMSHHDAESCLKFNSIDLDYVKQQYIMLFEPESLKFRKSKNEK